MATTARFLVLWGTPEDPEKFDRHYREVHIPLVQKLPGLRRYTLSRNAVAVRGGDPYYRVAELDFDDVEALRAAFGSDPGRETAADVSALSAGAPVHSMIYELEDVMVVGEPG
jgi:uncharacterized protein (TIGR02118 family)